MQILPSIDLRSGKVVRLQQGDYARQINYEVEPLAVAQSFQKAGASWMHIVDLDGAKEGKPVQTDLIGSIIKSTSLKVEVGGGIRTTDDIQILLDAGVHRVVVGTKALQDWHWFERTVQQFKNKIVLALDAKEGKVAVAGWTQTSDKYAVDIATWVSDWPVAAILYTDVAKDGMMQGPNVEHTKKLCEAGKVPVIASGGVGNIDHIRALTKIPVWGAIVGRSLYEGKVDLREAIRVASGG